MKHFTKKIALLGLLIGLSSSSWAQEVYWSADFSSEPNGMTYSVTNGSTDISSGVLSLNQGGGSGNRAINITFTDEAFTSHDSYSFEFDWGGSSSNQNTSTMTLLSDVSSPLLTITWAQWATTASISDASGNVLTSTLPIDGYSKKTPTNLSHFVINVNSLGAYLTVTNNGTTYVDNKKIGQKGYITGFGGALGRAVSYAAIDNISLSEFAEADVSTVANYTIKFVDTEGNTIKEDQTDSGTIGEFIELDGSYTANFWLDETKYIYVSDNASSITVAENGSSVVTVTFRQASTFSYTVVNNFGEIIKEGSVVEGESDIFAYPEYIEVDGTLYKASIRNATGDGYFLYKISPTADGEELTIEYTEAVNNVVYFSEAEDIEGATPNNGNNTNIRCSNAYGAYFENDVTIATLPAGVYMATVQVWGNEGTTFNILAGETPILEAATVGYLNTYTSEEFTLTEETDIIIPTAGSNGKVIDYIYIVNVPVKYSYKVSTSNGTLLAEGTASEGATITVPYPRYELVDGTLYTNPATGKEYNYTFTLLEDSEITLDYTATDITDVVYFSEGENIDGATATSAGNNMKIRSSNAACGYTESDITLISLPAGHYKAVMVSYSNSSSGLTEKFKLGEEAYDVVIEGSSNWYGSEIEFTFTETADVQWLASGDSKNGLDYIYIVKLPDVLLGDANGDGDVDISDVVAVVNYILNDGASGNFVIENADVNGDGTVDISDVVGIVNIILNGE